jgi:hypothetical protein
VNQTKQIFRLRLTRSVIRTLAAIVGAALLGATTTCCSLISREFATPAAAIQTVRNGAFVSYPAVPIGKAFETTFKHSRWRTFAGSRGETVVEYTGTVTAQVLRDHHVGDLGELMGGSEAGAPEPEVCPSEYKALKAGPWVGWDRGTPERAAQDAKYKVLKDQLTSCEDNTTIKVLVQFLISQTKEGEFYLNYATIAERQESSLEIESLVCSD